MTDIPRHFRRLVFRLTALLVAVGAAVAGTFLYLHREEVSSGEIVVFAALVFLVLPGVVYLLYLRFQDALEDVTAAEALASAAAESRQVELTQVVDALIDPILSIDVRGEVLTANPAVRKIFGWRPEEIVGHNVRMLMAEPYRSQHDEYIANYLRTGIPKAIGRIRRVEGVRKDGTQFPVEISLSQVVDPDGTIRFVGIIRDISEREEMSARLSQAERLAAIGELAAGVAHEVNNPVNTILNCAQLMKDGEQDHELLDDIMHEGMRIASIVRDLLDFARDHGDEHSPTRVQDVIDRTLSLVSHRIAKQGITLDVDVDADLPTIKGRSQQLQQVLLNLLLNARDSLVADPRGQAKRISIGARRHSDATGERLRVHVRDNGPGIDRKNIERIFQPFFTTKRDRGGTGLGLAVSLGIVKSHQGQLTVESLPGEFTEFVVDLPVDNGWQGEPIGAHRSD